MKFEKETWFIFPSWSFYLPVPSVHTNVAQFTIPFLCQFRQNEIELCQDENQDRVSDFQFRFREKKFRQYETEFCQKENYFCQIRHQFFV